MPRLILFNKPFNVLCQFTDGEGRPTLAQWIKLPGFYAAGRLDMDSEGLVLLTDDGTLTARIADPKHKIAKTYQVQVEGIPSAEALESLRTGVRLNDGMTLPAQVRVIEPPEGLWERTPPIRFRKNDITTWLELVIREGRNRQVRRMTAAVGLPTLRLVRVAVGDWTLEGLSPGESRVLEVNLPAAKPPGSAPKPAQQGHPRPKPASAPRGKGRPPSAPPSGPRPPRPSRASRKARGS